MAATSLPHPADTTSMVMEDLVRESLGTLLPVTVGLAWLWLAAQIVSRSAYQDPAYVVLVVLGTAAWASHALQARRPGGAVGIYLLSLVVAVTLIAWAVRDVVAFQLYALVVLVAAVLSNPRTMWGIALASVGLVLAIGDTGQHLPAGDLIATAGFILLAALAAWLSARRLFTALGWTLRMTQEAQKNAREARERRAEVRSILKSLEEAYVRLERANQALIFAREAAEKAYRFKAEFVANVSHELRTPLNLIVGFSEMMATAPESYKGRRLPSQYRGDVMAIYRSAQHLSELIDDVLDLAQIEAGRLPLVREEADLDEIIREAVSIIRGLAKAKGLRVELDVAEGLPRLRLDRTRIRQVLLNLLSNATRFTDQGWIRVRARQEGDVVRVSVADSGRGIAPERVAQAFEAFSQLDEDRARQGSGLGLAVSRKFVELHGGSMWIDSTLGQGTTVGFRLPTSGDAQGARPALLRTRAPGAAQEERPLVLVVHDDPHALALLRRYVDGFQFLQAESLAQAVELAQQTPPLAVLMDSRWAEDREQLAARAALPEAVPILVCPLPSLHRLGLLLGAGDYLAKPLRREDLVAALERLPRRPRKVLVIDDDPNFARLLVRVLKAHDASIEVLMASGGVEGLAAARAEHPDLVLLDLLMPEVSGYAFLEEVQRDPALAGMAVIIMSGRALEQEVIAPQGVLEVTRPTGFTLSEMLQAIQSLLSVVTVPAAVARASA